MANGLKPFKVQPYLVWTVVIAILVMVVFASTRSNYVSMNEYEPIEHKVTPPIAQLNPSSAQTLSSQIPADTPVPAIQFRPDLFPTSSPYNYEQVNLSLQPLELSMTRAVRPVYLDVAEEDAMYNATLDDIFKASEQQGFMEASVDTLYNVSALKPSRLMTNEV
jgi:hypothetical protein